MRYSFLAFAVVVLLTIVVGVAANPPKLGPEWTYDEEMKEYKKTMPIKVTRSGGGNVQNYHLELRHDKVRAYDTDENITTGVRLNDTMSLEVWRKQKGGGGIITVAIGKCVYHDLDRDGVWDSWYDRRGGAHSCFIRRDGAWVEVCHVKGGLVGGDGAELSLDRKTEYTWDGTEWKSRPVDR